MRPGSQYEGSIGLERNGRYLMQPRTANNPLCGALAAVLALAALLSPLSASAQGLAPVIRVGNLVDYSGRTAVVGRMYGRGKEDAVRYINRHGGINGLDIELLTVDYAYVLPQAVTAYEQWHMDGGVVAVQGWGTADIRALKDLVTRDHVPFFSSGFDADRVAMTMPGPGGDIGAPYHFFLNPGAIDSVKALLQWAQQDWWASGTQEQPVYVHMGDGSEFATVGLEPGEAYAKELGFKVIPTIRYGSADEDGKACESLKTANVDYAYLANASDANAALLTTCRGMGVTTHFMTNIWGYDGRLVRKAGTAANGMVWVMANAAWGEKVPGMRLLEDIAREGAPPDADEAEPRSIHYIQGVCAIFFMKDAMERASFMPGGITGDNIRVAMYEKKAWAPLGLKGVCNRGSWSPTDHQGITDIWVYKGHVTDEGSSMTRVYTAIVPKPISKGQDR